MDNIEPRPRFRFTRENASAFGRKGGLAKKKRRDEANGHGLPIDAVKANPDAFMADLAHAALTKLGMQARRTTEPVKLGQIAAALERWRGLLGTQAAPVERGRRIIRPV